MTAFRTHFLEKYFWYRRRYVEYILAQAPARAVLANLSEAFRLAFVAAGSALMAAILWPLTVAAAFGRSPWTVVYALLAASVSAAALFAVAGAIVALRDRRRVQEAAAAAANASPR